MPDDIFRLLADPSAPRPAGAWGAFLLFLIPVGGGIPAGVLLARAGGVSPLMMEVLYFVSDVVLAFIAEPLIRGILAVGRWIPFLERLGRAMSRFFQRGGTLEGSRGPLGLVLVSFSVDPMTGRATAAAAGYGFVLGWAFAIAGDMLYFTVLMASTLWLNGVVGDERLTIGIMLLVTLALPFIRRRRA